MRDDLAGGQPPEPVLLAGLDPAEAVAVRDAVEDAAEPRIGIGQRAVEVEDDEADARAVLGVRPGQAALSVRAG
ncbi:hypothetical protein AOPFMNJM_1897 [Methylobacterium jeotgali]|uniref:Uncharacterized protein n=1 Tax=Methylobacterium jeotgali TaxID=381630 RepID=A0ABQ4SXA2_9HYPH|nr:hypothetical protein AOPFMNJM_1897 [Methylobacterium jeotgali]